MVSFVAEGISLYHCLILATILTNCIYDTKGSPVKSKRDATEYLRKYGYLYEPTSSYIARKHPKTMHTFSEAISMFQMYSGLERTGVLSEETMTRMNTLRCGMAERMDIPENKIMNRALVSHKIPKIRKWQSSELRYKVHNFPSSGIKDSAIVRKEIRRAFRLWEGVADIRCIEYDQLDERPVELSLIFFKRDHGDNSAFGNYSVGNVAAHAFYPDHDHFSGDIHFDDERLWTSSDNTMGLNLFQVAAHEIGHALGLEHSMYPESVMNAILHADIDDNFELHEDDILGIQNLYGCKSKGLKQYRRISTSYCHKTDASKSDRLHQPNSRFVPIPTPTEEEVVKPKVVINVIGADSDNALNIGNFWRCFEKSVGSRRSSQVADCYVKNSLHLLYSMNA